MKVLLVTFGLAVVALACGPSAQAPMASGEVVIRATEWQFEPAAFKAEAGKSFKLTFRNEGKIEHDLTVPGLKANGKALALNTQPGQSASAEVVADRTGVYEIACTLPGHKEAGMVGKLEVVAAGAGG